MSAPETQYDQCYAQMEALVGSDIAKQANRNEATTRLQLIDALLFSCLGWKKENCLAEEAADGEYADYTLAFPRRLLIVEAKREGEYFEVPTDLKQATYSLASLCRDNPKLKKAAIQVAGYCANRGVPYSAVSNGHQIVAFLAVRTDGIAPLEGRCLLYASLAAMRDDFLNFYNALSPAALAKHRLRDILLGESVDRPVEKLSTYISSYPGSKNRNAFQTDLKILSDLVFEDAPKHKELEREFLEKCYCSSGALSKHSMVSRAILQSRYAALFEEEEAQPLVEPAVSRSGISPEIIGESMSRRPILLLGDVGVGKTTFLKNLMTGNQSGMRDDAVSLYIDLGSQATLASDLKEFFVESIALQLRVQEGFDIEQDGIVRGIYDLELKRFAKGIYSSIRETQPVLYAEKELDFLESKVRDRPEHIRSALEHLSKARRKQIVIFIDNADQRNDLVQQEAFLIAQEVAQSWPASVFVALRPETFHASSQRGSLSGYHPKAFTIAPPRVDEVIRKRLAFAMEIASGGLPLRSAAGVSVSADSLKDLITVFLQSIDRSDEIIELIENISRGNIRLALDTLVGFFGSGHVDTGKIIRKFRETGKYYIPLHELVRAVLYGDNIYFDPERSPLANLFDVSQNDAREHFLVPLLVSYLRSPGGAASEHGFVEIWRIYEQLQGHGFLPDQIDSALIRAYRKRLVESSGRRVVESGSNAPSALRVTSVGQYHESRLSGMFTYLDAVVVDTPILDEECRHEIHDVSDLVPRLDRARRFVEYLSSCWERANFQHAVFDWPTHASAVEQQIASIELRLPPGSWGGG